jgi:hypothetical protein
LKEIRRHSHTVMEQIKIPVVIDGDLAVTLMNLIGDAVENDTINDLIFCGHTVPKVEALYDLLAEKTDIENREEE